MTNKQRALKLLEKYDRGELKPLDLVEYNRTDFLDGVALYLDLGFETDEGETVHLRFRAYEELETIEWAHETGEMDHSEYIEALENFNGDLETMYNLDEPVRVDTDEFHYTV